MDGNIRACVFYFLIVVSNPVFALRTDNDYGLVWKVEGYDDRYPGDLGLFDRVGVYGTLKDNQLHNNYMGACTLSGLLVWHVSYCGIHILQCMYPCTYFLGLLELFVTAKKRVWRMTSRNE